MSMGMSMGPESRARLARAEERHHIEEQIDADALKPVDDDAVVVRPEVSPETHHRNHHTSPGKGNQIVTSSNVHKENQPLHTQGHKHTGSKGTTISRIDTSGTVPARQSPSGKSSSNKRKE